MVSTDWNWYGDAEKGEIIIPRVDAIAVYSNENNDIVIRQQGNMEDDHLIIIPRAHAQTVVDALQRLMREG